MPLLLQFIPFTRRYFSDKGDANFSFCFSRHLRRIESIYQSKDCKVNHIVYDPSTSHDSRLPTDCESATANRVSKGGKVFISKSASFCQTISRRCENKIKRLNHPRGAPNMSGGRRVFREISLWIIPHYANPKTRD